MRAQRSTCWCRKAASSPRRCSHWATPLDARPEHDNTTVQLCIGSHTRRVQDPWVTTCGRGRPAGPGSRQTSPPRSTLAAETAACGPPSALAAAALARAAWLHRSTPMPARQRTSRVARMSRSVTASVGSSPRPSPTFDRFQNQLAAPEQHRRLVGGGERVCHSAAALSRARTAPHHERPSSWSATARPHRRAVPGKRKSGIVSVCTS